VAAAQHTAPAASHADAVAVVITRRVKPGRQAEYEGWLQQFQAEARGLNGYLGVTTQRPAAGAPLDYVSVLRFNSLASLQAFERSELRARQLEKVRDFVEGDAAWRRLTGLEFWFTPPPGTVVPQRSRPRMALVMIAVVFGLVLGLGSLVNLAFAQLPFATPYAVRLLVTITIEVLLMTYWLMPLVTRRLAAWIYPSRRVA
jgi:hypothetical protein